MTGVMLEIAACPVARGLLVRAASTTSTPGHFAFAVELTRITIPYLLLISLVSLLGGILSSLDKFWVNAAAPILLNIAMVIALAAVLPRGDTLLTARAPGDRGDRSAARSSSAGSRCRAPLGRRAQAPPSPARRPK